MKAALIVAPVVASYSPTVLLLKLATKRWLLPSIVSATGVESPWPLTKAALMVAPVVALYSPTVLLLRLATKRSGCPWAGPAASVRVRVTSKTASHDGRNGRCGE